MPLLRDGTDHRPHRVRPPGLAGSGTQYAYDYTATICNISKKNTFLDEKNYCLWEKRDGNIKQDGEFLSYHYLKF